MVCMHAKWDISEARSDLAVARVAAAEPVAPFSADYRQYAPTCCVLKIVRVLCSSDLTLIRCGIFLLQAK